MNAKGFLNLEEIKFSNGSKIESVPANEVIRGISSTYITHVVKPLDYKYYICERSNGSKYIKVMTYIYDADGYVEVARINASKSYWTTNGYFTMDDLFSELDNNNGLLSLLRQRVIEGGM